MQSEDVWMDLHVLHRQGWTIAALAREYGLDWRTARKYATATAPPTYRARARPTDLTEAQLAHVERRLAGCPELRTTVLLRELGDRYGYLGSYTSLRRRVALLRPASELDPVLRFETGPGVQTQGDWTDCGPRPLGDGVAHLFAWVAVLGCSRMVAVRFATDKTRPTTLRAIVRATDDLGGSTAEHLHDRDAALVIGSRADGSAILAPEWVDTALLLGTRPKATRPYRAKTKGKVERAIREVKEDLLASLDAASLPEHPTLADYDAAARRWALEVVATRRHRTTGRIVGEAWAEERPHLVPVPRRVLARAEGIEALPSPVPGPVDRRMDPVGEVVEVRPLAVYAELAR
ncbi:MAG: IS21 family transposase [Chloroflexota bacterium]